MVYGFGQFRQEAARFTHQSRANFLFYTFKQSCWHTDIHVDLKKIDTELVRFQDEQIPDIQSRKWCHMTSVRWSDVAYSLLTINYAETTWLLLVQLTTLKINHKYCELYFKLSFWNNCDTVFNQCTVTALHCMQFFGKNKAQTKKMSI